MFRSLESLLLLFAHSFVVKTSRSVLIVLNNVLAGKYLFNILYQTLELPGFPNRKTHSVISNKLRALYKLIRQNTVCKKKTFT